MSSPSADAAMREPWLLYDGECPFCSAYVKLVRLRETIGQVRLIDARQGGPELAELRGRGLDINQGMALKLDGQIYYGADCINVLALLSTPSGAFNRFNHLIFQSKSLSRLLYPALRTGRNAALALLGRSKIA